MSKKNVSQQQVVHSGGFSTQLDPAHPSYPDLLGELWRVRLPSVDASAVPLCSLATALGRQMELFHEDLLKPLGYQLSEYRLLVSLFTGPELGMTLVQLNKVLRQSSAGITKTATRLENRQLIERHANPADSRSVLIQLTERGYQEIEVLCERVAQAQNKKLAWLSNTQRSEAQKGLQLLLQSMS